MDLNSKPLCPEGPSRKNEGGAGAWESCLDLPGWGWKGQKFHKKGKEKPSWCPGLGDDAQMDVTCPGFIPLSRNLGFSPLGIRLGRFISLFFPGLFPFFPLQAGIPSLALRRFFRSCLFIKDTAVQGKKTQNPQKLKGGEIKIRHFRRKPTVTAAIPGRIGAVTAVTSR